MSLRVTKYWVKTYKYTSNLILFGRCFYYLILYVDTEILDLNDLLVKDQAQRSNSDRQYHDTPILFL